MVRMSLKLSSRALIGKLIYLCMFFLFFVFCFQYKYLLASFLSNRDLTGASKKFLPSPPSPTTMVWVQLPDQIEYNYGIAFVCGRCHCLDSMNILRPLWFSHLFSNVQKRSTRATRNRWTKKHFENETLLIIAF